MRNCENESVKVAVASANARAGAAIIEANIRADTAARIRAATAIALINNRAEAAIAEANKRTEIAEMSLANMRNHGKNKKKHGKNILVQNRNCYYHH